MKNINLGLMKGNLFVQYIGYERIIVSNTYIMLNADRKKQFLIEMMHMDILKI